MMASVSQHLWPDQAVDPGPAGCAVAAGLANTPKKPSVLLLEAGGANEDRNLRVDGQRWTTFTQPDMNWGYKTAPQAHCAGREIDYARGRGVGGSSTINFGVYSIGARDDYDEWARVVGDDAFRWERMQPRFKALETFTGELPAGIDRKYAAPRAEDHGADGPLRVGYAAEWEEDIPGLLDVFVASGFPLNPDHNSGNPIGISALINSSHEGLRTTAKDLVTPRPSNLTIVTGSPVQRLVLDGKKIIGVESEGERYFASKEVILSAGSLDTPKILLHSGIGPPKQLSEFGIPLVHALEAVGKGLRDHMWVPLVHTRTESSASRGSFYGDKQAMDDALEQWKRDGTGPWSKYACETGIAYAKFEDLATYPEFGDLPASEQSYLLSDTVPHYEIFTHFPIHFLTPDFPPESLNYLCLLVFYYNAQSRGEVTLQSPDPRVPLKFDPRFLASPFDRRAAVETLRRALRVVRHEAYARDCVELLAGPKSDEDEDLLDYWVHNIGSSWHMTGTAKMGTPGTGEGEGEGDPDAVVDSDFRVAGIDGLRIADMSVVPILPSCHTQAVAYITGVTCAEKLAQQYELV
ncbi:hypothetical protein SLS62_009247 [Diatrype stigma]|uniref:Glucose-methanol-choline oxidoreductase N-terminal domain-containing protein n=1 Tax=Diatrype stigma TaxID=117547 RepID=A0AAN9UHK1_9PEZI